MGLVVLYECESAVVRAVCDGDPWEHAASGKI